MTTNIASEAATKHAKLLLLGPLVAAVFVVGLHANDSKASPAKRAATLTLGAQNYEFDWVMCAPGPAGSTMVIASDRAKRPVYPTVRLTVYPQAGHSSFTNTFSVDFMHDSPRILWLLKSGSVDKTPDGTLATGELEGSEMVKQTNGSVAPVPLDDGAVRTFEFQASCQ